MLYFEWNEKKAIVNFRRHKVTFEEAKTVFDDPVSTTIDDSRHSVGEERYIDIGISSQGRLLVVVYTERETKIRIISCRKATMSERSIYEERAF